MRVHVLGACLAGAAMFCHQRFARDAQRQKWFGSQSLLATFTPAVSAFEVQRGPMHIEQRHLRGTRASPLVSLCSASINDSHPTAPQPPQFALVRMAGDGNCLFRALATGAYLLEDEDAGGAGLAGMRFEEQTQQADMLRSLICKELLSRREDIEPFIDDDFDAYVARMQQSRTWGGEPELAVATHVLRRPISVYSAQGQAGLSLVSQYGKDDYPRAADVTLLFHGAGHYDLLMQSDVKSRL